MLFYFSQVSFFPAFMICSNRFQNIEIRLQDIESVTVISFLFPVLVSAVIELIFFPVAAVFWIQ